MDCKGAVGRSYGWECSLVKRHVQKRTEVNAGLPAAGHPAVGHPRGYSAFLFSHFSRQDLLNFEFRGG